jgi:hypothetical protein
MATDFKGVSMNRLFMFAAVSSAVFLIGCNMIGRKDEVLARVGNQDIMLSELDFALSTAPEDRRTSPETRKMVFQNLLNTRILGEAGREYVPQASADVEEKLNALKKRDLASIYYRVFIQENLGHTDDEIYAWFRKNEKRFSSDSVKADFKVLKDSVVKLMTIEEHEAELKPYFERHYEIFADKKSADVGLLLSSDSMELVQAVKRIDAGESFDQVAASVIKDSSLLSRKGRIGVVTQGQWPRELALHATAVDLLFDAKTRPKEAKFLPVAASWNTPKTYAAITAFRYIDPPRTTFEEIQV